ncbi:MAG: hypothetical protein ACP5M9_00430 [Candidatus Micrarchaeia archaeon]
MKTIKGQSAMEYLMTYGWAILIIAIVLVALFELGIFGGSTLPTACVAQSGFVCQNPVWASSNIVVSIGQNSGQAYTVVNLAFLSGTNLATFQSTPTSFPSGTSFSAASDGLSTMGSGAIYSANVPSDIASPSINQGISGQIWLEYTAPGSSTDQFVEVATLTAKYT